MPDGAENFVLREETEKHIRYAQTEKREEFVIDNSSDLSHSVLQESDSNQEESLIKQKSPQEIEIPNPIQHWYFDSSQDPFWKETPYEYYEGGIKFKTGCPHCIILLAPKKWTAHQLWHLQYRNKFYNKFRKLVVNYDSLEERRYYNCTLCDYRNESFKEYAFHTFTHRRYVSENFQFQEVAGSREYKCMMDSKCKGKTGKIFLSKETLQAHLDVHIKEQESTAPRYSFSEDHELLPHFQCHLCSMVTFSKAELASHVELHKDGINPEQLVKSQNKRKMVVEATMEGGDIKLYGVSPAKQCSEKGQRGLVKKVVKYKCKQCPQQFLSRDEIEKHVQSHNRESLSCDQTEEVPTSSEEGKSSATQGMAVMCNDAENDASVSDVAVAEDKNLEEDSEDNLDTNDDEFEFEDTEEERKCGNDFEENVERDSEREEMAIIKTDFTENLAREGSKYEKSGDVLNGDGVADVDCSGDGEGDANGDTRSDNASNGVRSAQFYKGAEVVDVKSVIYINTRCSDIGEVSIGADKDNIHEGGEHTGRGPVSVKSESCEGDESSTLLQGFNGNIVQQASCSHDNIQEIEGLDLNITDTRNHIIVHATSEDVSTDTIETPRTENHQSGISKGPSKDNYNSETGKTEKGNQIISSSCRQDGPSGREEMRNDTSSNSHELNRDVRSNSDLKTNVPTGIVNPSETVSTSCHVREKSPGSDEQEDATICTFCAEEIPQNKIVEHFTENHLQNFYSSSKMETFHCKQCKSQFLSESDLREHLIDSHLTSFCQEIEIDSFRCKLCSLNIKYQMDIGKHMQRKHKDRVQQEISMCEEYFTTSKIGMVKCVVCGAQFFSEDDLFDHVETEHWNEFCEEVEVSLYCCSVCSLNIKTQKEIKAHITRKHLEQLLKE